MADIKDNNNDSDLEIIPNPEPIRNVLDLSMNNDTVQSIIDDMNEEQHKHQQSTKKRAITSIKQEEIIHEPTAKKRKLNNNDSKPIVCMKQEKKQKEIIIKKTRKKVKKSTNKKQTKKTSNSLHNFNTFNTGLNYGGQCSNNNCVAFNTNVIMQRGFGMFQPNKDSHNCPSCSKPFKLKYIYLYKCVVIIRSKTCGKTNIKREVMSIKRSDYVKYDYKIKDITTHRRSNRNNNSNNSN
eukprot:495360_1